MMLARIKLFNIMNQAKYQQMLITRKVINADSCPHTFALLDTKESFKAIIKEYILTYFDNKNI